MHKWQKGGEKNWKPNHSELVVSSILEEFI